MGVVGLGVCGITLTACKWGGGYFSVWAEISPKRPFSNKMASSHVIKKKKERKEKKQTLHTVYTTTSLALFLTHICKPPR